MYNRVYSCYVNIFLSLIVVYSYVYSVNSSDCIGDPVGDNDQELSGEVLTDGWILDVKQLSWTKVGTT